MNTNGVVEGQTPATRGKDAKVVQGRQAPHPLPLPESIASQKVTRNPFAAFAVQPSVRFETQDQEEKIILLLRRHPITNLRWMLTATFLSVVPFFWELFPFYSSFPARFRVVFVALWCLLVLAFIFEHFLSWYFNVYLITDERVVDVDFYSLLYKEVSETKIDNIQDVTFITGGLLRSIFNFGTVAIQTAGERREFEFEDVPQPQVVAKILNELLLEEEQEKIEGRVR